MSTSLSRQLEQLRTVSQAGPASTQSTSTLGPNLLESQLGAEQLTLLAKEALESLTSTCPVLESYKCVLFKDDPHDPLPEDDDDNEEPRDLEDLLFLLSPYLLKPPAQYLLQYLVTRHDIHRKHAETLLFALIPYYQYTIFHRMVDALPTRFGKARAEEEFPRWVENFKHACHPATTIGLVRHLASDSGFFKLFCHIWHGHLKHHMSKFENELGVTYDHVIHFLTTIMVKALNILNVVSDQQVLSLLEVILAGIKSQHKEYRSGIVILFASLIPRIRLNAKAAKKVLKSLSKVENKDVETLSMLALLFRCQVNVLDCVAIMEEFVQLKSILQAQVFSNVQKRVDEDQEFARRLMKTLALLCQKVLESERNPDELMANYLDLLFNCLKECLPSAETAEILIVCLSRQFVLWKDQKNEDYGKRCVSICKKILDWLRKSFAEEYSRKCTLQSQSDILFIQGVEEPTAEMVAIQKTLMDNQFVQAMTAVITDIDKGTVKSNRQAVKLVLQGSTSFLQSQMTASGLRQFCLNVLELYPKKLKMAKEAITHIHQTENNDNVDASLLILQLLFTPTGNLWEHTLGQISSIYPKSQILKISLSKKITISKSHF